MKPLYERLLDNEDNLVSGMDDELLKSLIYKTYGKSRIRKITIEDHKYAYIEGHLMITNSDIVTLEIPGVTIKHLKGDFSLQECHNLKNFAGVPEEMTGTFFCNYCDGIVSLEGCPKKVGRSFVVGLRNLMTLEGGPEVVGGDFYCDECLSITSLKGAPREVGGDFNCSSCISLETLEGAPEKVDKLFCLECPALKSFKGCPDKVTVLLAQDCTNLESVKYLPKKLKTLNIENCNNIKDLGVTPIKVNNLFISRDMKYNPNVNYPRAKGPKGFLFS